MPSGHSVRPTGDRVREAVFNALTSLGALQGARVLDPFAGSGALGIEALSRGAASAVFVDDSPAALAAVRANLEHTHLVDQAQVVRSDALRFLAGVGAVGAFDVALLDPPYAFDRWEDLLALVDAPLVVVESNRPVELGSRWVLMRERRYGATVVMFAALAVPEGSTHPVEPTETAADPSE